MTAAANPRQFPSNDMMELTSARGFAALMVLIYHVDAYCGDVLKGAVPSDYLGPLPVDFFFALSGFVLAHVYRSDWLDGRYSHLGFVIRRFARIWPLHMMSLLAVAVIVIGGAAVGFAPPWSPSVSSFAAHVGMIHATGATSELAWNQPSWSVSAEWTAYLAFPVYLWFAHGLRTPTTKLAAVAIVALGLMVTTEEFGRYDLFALTNAGALRIIPSFFAGVVLRELLELGYGRSLSAHRLNRMLLEVSGVMIACMYAGAATIMIWPGLLALLYLLALRSQVAKAGVLRARPFVWFGEISYALYIVHAPVLMVAFGVGAKVAGVAGQEKLLLGLVAVLAAICAAALAHVLVERPAQRLILALADRAALLGRRRVAPVAA